MQRILKDPFLKILLSVRVFTKDDVILLHFLKNISLCNTNVKTDSEKEQE